MSSEEGGEKVVKVDNGSFVEVDYVIKVKEVDELVDTTIEEEAKKAGQASSGAIYRPRLTIIGKGFLLRAIEEELVGMKENDHKRFEIPPEKAFGRRDPSKVKVLPLKRFKDLDQPISVGTRVMIDGREGIIRSIGSGRVQVDFNHYLADKTLVCDIWVRKIILDRVEKIQALIQSRIPEATPENTVVELGDSIVTVKLPKDVYLLSGLQLIKRTLSRELMDNVDGINKVVFVEEYEKEG